MPKDVHTDWQITRLPLVDVRKSLTITTVQTDFIAKRWIPSEPFSKHSPSQRCPRVGWARGFRRVGSGPRKVTRGQLCAIPLDPASSQFCIPSYSPELSTSPFSWTRPDPTRQNLDPTRPDPWLPTKSLTRHDPTRGPTLRHMYIL